MREIIDLKSKTTMTIYCMLVLFICIFGTKGQRDDSNPNTIITRATAWDKQPRCEIYQYFEFTDSTGVTMVDRSKFLMVFNGNTYEFDCAPGTLFSIEPNLCVCSTSFFLINQDNYERCVSINGDFQGSSDFSRVQTGITSTAYIGGYDDMFYSQDLNCFTSNELGYPYMPFFDANSFTHDNFDLTLRFYLAPAASFLGQEFPLVSFGPCGADNRSAAFALSLRNTNNVWSFRLDLGMRDLYMAQQNSVEYNGRVECTLSPIITATGSLPWTVTDNTSLVRVFGNIDDFTNIRIEALNGASGAQAGVNEIPEGGYCQAPVTRSLTGLLRRGGRGIVAERNCPLDFGRIPRGFQMCMSTAQISRDC